MSILDKKLNNIYAISSAQEIINQTRQTFDQMSQSFNDGATLFWNNPYGVSPSEIAEYLGNDAVEIFRLHYALGQFLASIKPDSISRGLSLVGQFTMNDDGTVTIIDNDTTPPQTPSDFKVVLIDEQ